MLADPWADAKEIIGTERVTLGPQASDQWLHAPDHLAMVLARYRAAAALIGDAETVLELGAGEGIGALILAKGRARYCGVDNDALSIEVARQTVGTPPGDPLGQWRPSISFAELDILTPRWLPGTIYESVVSLDVIEHVPAEREEEFVGAATGALVSGGVFVVGTPNATFDHLASPQSHAGHINTYTHDRLHALMARHFRLVQAFGMQDVSLHLGHPDARHYLLMAGIGVR